MSEESNAPVAPTKIYHGDGTYTLQFGEYFFSFSKFRLFARLSVWPILTKFCLADGRKVRMIDDKNNHRRMKAPSAMEMAATVRDFLSIIMIHYKLQLEPGLLKCYLNKMTPLIFIKFGKHLFELAFSRSRL